MTLERARDNWNYYNRMSAKYAQRYFTGGYDYERALSKKYYALACRWEWAGFMIEARRVFKDDYIRELLKKYPEYYRVRPQ